MNEVPVADDESSLLPEVDLFKEEFKHFKRKKPPPDFSRVLDFSQVNSLQPSVQQDEHLFPYDCNIKGDLFKASSLGLSDPSEWHAYGIRRLPGLVFVVNPFTAEGQRTWIRKALEEYPKCPNITNLDTQKQDDPLDIVSLRWVTLGFHHNWNTKVYSRDCQSPFPMDLAQLTTFMAQTLGFQHFVPQSAIINYYHKNSTLGGHTDHSELDVEAPLFSLSFGQTAIFLIGGKTKSVRPVAMFLRSGDVVVMAGESRLAFHGVPRILLTDAAPWIETSGECYVLQHYMSRLRININVRQVFPLGEIRAS